MTLTLPPRVLSKLHKFAPLLGGEDADGVYHQEKDSKKILHLFAIRDKDVDYPHWAFVNGLTILDLIVCDHYDIEYLGLTKDFVPINKIVDGVLTPQEPKTPAQKELRKKVLKYCRKQEQDIKAQERYRNEQMGIFETDADEDSSDTET